MVDFIYMKSYTREQINYPFKVYKDLGIKNIIITNSSGSLNGCLKTIMIIDKHINFSFEKILWTLK